MVKVKVTLAAQQIRPAAARTSLDKSDAQRQPAQQRQRRAHQRLPKQDAADAALAHAQYVVQAKLPLAAANQKGMFV